MSKLTKLELSFNEIHAQGALKIVQNCTHMTRLAYIDLSYNNIGSQGVRALVPSLVLMTNLTYIKLNNNSIRQGVMPTIKILFEQMPNLKVVIE
jgi:Ran GTPase-activating protein (RanGAP) involved in mRNA processing and transport